MKPFHRIFSILFAINIFKTPIRFRVKDRDYFSSIGGVFISLIIYSYLFFALITSDAFSKTNPVIFQKDVENPNAGWFNFDETNMFFAISVTNINAVNTYVDPTIFSAYATYYTYNLTASGYVGSKKVVPMVLCNQTFAKKALPNIVKQFPYALCLPNPKFQIGGYFNEPVTKTLNIIVSYCKNSTANNHSCRPKEEILNFFKTKSMKIAYVITQNLFSPDSYQNPIYQRNNTKNFALDVSIRKYHRISLQKVSIINDDSLFFTNQNKFESWKVGETENGLDMATDEEIFQFVITSTDKETVISRRYMKLQEALGSLGGMVKVFETLGFLLLSLSPFGGIYMFMARNLFSFQNAVNRKKIIQRRPPMKRKDSSEAYDAISDQIDKNQVLLTEMTELSQQKDSNVSKKTIQASVKNESHPENNNPMSVSIEITDNSKLSPCVGDKEIVDEVKSFGTREKSMKCIQGLLQKEKSLEIIQDIFKKRDATLLLEEVPTKKKLNIRSKSLGRGCLFWRKKKTKKNTTVDDDFSFAKNFKQYCEMKKDIKNLDLNPLDLLRGKDSRKRFFKKYEALKTAHDKIKSNLDIVTIMEKFQEIDKLKMILFTKEQLMLFSLLAKPEILIGEKKKSLHESACSSANFLRGSPGRLVSEPMRRMEDRSDANFVDLILYYNKIKNKGFQDDLDGRLIKLLDDDMKTYFDL